MNTYNVIDQWVERVETNPEAGEAAWAEIRDKIGFQEEIKVYPRSSGNPYQEDPRRAPLILLWAANTSELVASLMRKIQERGEVNWQEITLGITSRLFEGQSGLHLPILDYDEVPKKSVVAEVKALQKKFSLGDAYLYKTKGGHHVYFFHDSIAFSKYTDIIKTSEYVCEGFKKITLQNKLAVLRVSCKYPEQDIKFKGVLHSDSPNLVSTRATPFRKKLIVDELIGLNPFLGALPAMFPWWTSPNYRSRNPNKPESPTETDRPIQAISFSHRSQGSREPAGLSELYRNTPASERANFGEIQRNRVQKPKKHKLNLDQLQVQQFAYTSSVGDTATSYSGSTTGRIHYAPLTTEHTKHYADAPVPEQPVPEAAQAQQVRYIVREFIRGPNGQDQIRTHEISPDGFVRALPLENVQGQSEANEVYEAGT